MFSRLASFAILALPILAVATPAARNDQQPTPACCDSTQSVSPAHRSSLYAIFSQLFT